ncbi:MAG: TldD/PmbA family protein [Methanothrix sp.]|nr:TldD/PmbA family protein [Methanothrix sp.]
MRISDTSDSLLPEARELLSLAIAAGAEEAEVYGMASLSYAIDLRRAQVELASQSLHRGLGLRAVVSGAVGFSSTSDMSLLSSVARSAVQSARARGSDPAWRGFPRPERLTQPEDIFDPRLAEAGAEECLELAEGLVAGCSDVAGAEPVSGGLACASGSGFIINSWGLEMEEAGTLMQASMEAIARGADVATGSEFSISRRLEPSLEEVGRSAAEMARSSLGGGKAESGTFDVLLRPQAVAELLESTLIPALLADNVQKGRSVLASRRGDMIASERLVIVDDGLLAGGIDSSAFDGEGVPSQKTVLVDGGILQGYLYDSYAAGKDSVRSTGNAMRSGYTAVPRVGARNFIVSSSDSCNLLEETHGYAVSGLIGAHTANAISGDFSVEARNAFAISPGEQGRPIRSLMLAGNIFDLLKEIEVGRDVRSVGSIVTPTVKLRMKVVGS